MYQFDPAKYGFRKVGNYPELVGICAKYAWIKVIAVSKQIDAYWYEACYALPDDRWRFSSSSYQFGKETYEHGHETYLGCITSHEYAVMLLSHLFGTTTNDGVAKYGIQRLHAKSISVSKMRKAYVLQGSNILT